MNMTTHLMRFRLASGTMAVAGVLVAAGCGGSSQTASSSQAASTPPPGISLPTPPPCPNPEGAACLGPIAAGTYTTTVFSPALTYTVPAGWKNFEDTPGNFLLVPARGNLPGVNAGTSDFIGVYTSVAAEKTACAENVPVFGVASKPAAMARWIRRNPGLHATAPRAVTIGHLHGVVLDITQTPGAGVNCGAATGGTRYVAVMMGLAPSGLDHGMIPGLRMRLYLLSYGGGALAIEVDDVRGGGAHIGEYSAVVKRFRFASE
jgi:hypothetical protein